MRSTLLVIFSAIALAGVFIGYWMMQASTPTSTIANSGPGGLLPAPKRNDPAVLVHVHSGENAWLKEHDGAGQLTSEFRGEQYRPKPNGTVDIVHPAAHFYLANHQRLEVRGETGNVVLKDVPDPGQTGFASTVAPSPPTRGRLEDVTVTLIDEMRPAGKQEALVMRTNNVVFDNETFRISTQGYRDEQGHLIEHDQVPVHVTGDIDMEGRGLRVRWNDRDGRLEELEIAHGDVLIIKDPSRFSATNGQKAPPEHKTTAAMGAGPPLPVMLAAADKQSAGEVITSFQRPATQPRARGAGRSSSSSGPVVYRARFFDNVRITQQDPSGKFDQLVINNADEMDLDFLLKQSSKEPATQPAAPAQPGAAPPVANNSAPPAQPSAAPAAPATQPVQKEQPIYVHWTGVLRITPVPGTPTVPLKPGDSAVRLVGLPVHVHRIEPSGGGQDDIRCASIVYTTDGQHIWLDRSQKFQQVLIDKAPAVSAREQGITHLIASGIVEYFRGQQRAFVHGAGQSDMPLESADRTQHPLMHVAWGRSAQFEFLPGGSEDQLVLHSGRLEGQVEIEHPRLNLKSKLLDLYFAPQSTLAGAAGKSQSQSTLRQAIATDDVYCRLTGADGKKQTIESNRLLLDTAVSDGKLYAHHINADGKVHAYSDDDLKADHLDALLKPSSKSRIARATTRPAGDDDTAQVELQEMVAWGHVTTKSKDGSVAVGDKLTVTTGNGRQHAILSSTAQAKVIDSKANFVTGPEIQFDSGDGRAYVIGPGTMHAIQQGSTTQPAQPIDVAWTTGAQFDGNANRIDADGGITARALEKNGAVDIATGDHIRIDLQKKPPAETQPAERTVAIQAADVQPKAAKKDADSGVNMDLFKDKEVVAFALMGNANMQSTLSAADGSVLQQMLLKAPKVIVREIDPNDPRNRTRTVTVPSAGTLGVRDHRKAVASQQGEANASGATRFDWDRSLVYSEARHQADMVGHVHIIHQDDDRQQPPVDMLADHAIAFFESPPQRPATRPTASTTREEDSKMQLKYVTLLAAPNETVVVNRGPDKMVARQVDYDPKRHVLIAYGTARNPVTFHGGTSLTTADHVEWDTITWDPKFTNIIMQYRPPTPPVQQPQAPPKLEPVKPTYRSDHQ